MTINKFVGRTKEEAIAKARAELGANAVIMNIKEIKPKGVLRLLQGVNYEVTAAVEEKENFVAPLNALKSNSDLLHENINLSADEKIVLPQLTKEVEYPRQQTSVSSSHYAPLQQKTPVRKPAVSSLDEDFEDFIEEELNIKPMERKVSSENVQPSTQKFRMDDLDAKESKPTKAEDDFLSPKETFPSVKEDVQMKNQTSEELNFVRILYSTLVKNEVNEKYANQIIGEIEKLIRPGKSVDTILSNVYQKLILRFGQPSIIELTAKKPKVVFFIGPTGVGKTTTIAKIASKYKVEYGKKIAFITLDTYRIAATEQLKVYANILDATMHIAYEVQELNEKVASLRDCDVIFVDTAGFSHRNDVQRNEMKELICGLDQKYSSEVYLVLSATTKYRDLLDIVDVYHEICEYKLIFTKLDETSAYGNLLNVRLYSNASLSYVTNGQNVPDDIEVFDTQKIVKNLLGGK